MWFCGLVVCVVVCVMVCVVMWLVGFGRSVLLRAFGGGVVVFLVVLLRFWRCDVCGVFARVDD
jgi:hypothetical protein